MLIKKYQVKNNTLKHLIKYFWIIKAEKVDLKHKYLPVSNIDLVLNLGHKIKYVSNIEEKIIQNRFFFNGITENYKLNIQKGELNMLGISFFPTGLFPFLKIPLVEFKNRAIEFDILYSAINQEIIDRIPNLNNIPHSLNTLEKIFLKYINRNLILDDKLIKIFKLFDKNIDELSVSMFSNKYGINKKRLERFFNKHVGTSPKTYAKIKRFQNIVKSLENNNYRSLTELAYDYNYYDQMHFIKDFKSFTGATPTDYIKQKSTLRDIIKSA